MAASKCAAHEVKIVEECVHRVAGDLALLAERSLVVESVMVEKRRRRPAGSGQVHISFKFGIEVAGTVRHGCLLMPLSDALAIAGCLMLQGDEEVALQRTLGAPDPKQREALVEIDLLVARALELALGAQGFPVVRVGPESCQGVRAEIRPALDYRDGEELWIGRAWTQLHVWPPFSMTLVLPALSASAAAAS